MFAIAIGWIAWVVATNIRRSKTARTVAEMHQKFLDKCEGGQDLLRYLESPPVRRFLESATNEGFNAFNRILNAVQAGVILLLLGATVLFLRLGQADPDIRQVLLTVGASLAALGAGFLISAGISYILAKTWGLLDRSR
ncbi:MAG: hypothetical protein KJZ78_04680 [Bryobacteraceae bacterium]|nr:hypothetical protein [Bryobacteraceae bacterium]